MPVLSIQNSRPFLLGVVTIVMCQITSPVFPQGETVRNPEYIQVLSNLGDVFSYSFQISPDGSYKEIHGSPFFNEDWKPGAIEILNDTVEYRFQMRYNMYGNQMQFIFKEDTFSIGNPLMVKSIRLDNHLFIYLPFHVGDNFNMAWFELLTERWPRLLVRHESRLQAGSSPVTPYHCQNDYDRFVARSVLYYQVSSEDEPVEVPTNQRDFVRLEILQNFGDYIKEQKLKARKSEDVIELFTYIGKAKSSL